MTDLEDEPAEGDGPAAPPRTANLAAVAAAVVLIGLVAFALYRRAHPPSAPGEPAAEATPSPAPGTPITAVVPFHLSPEASIAAERYRCVCGCGDLLNVCTCNKTPGSNDMKRALQDFVNRGLTPEQIDQQMAEHYGPAVLLSNAPAAAKATPAPRPAARRKPAATRRPS